MLSYLSVTDMVITLFPLIFHVEGFQAFGVGMVRLTDSKPDNLGSICTVKTTT